MAATRRDITTNQTDAANFVQGVLALKATNTGFTTQSIGIDPALGQPQPLSRWDLFVVWHVIAMQESFSNNRRNAAHSGPVFLPWHRWFLLVLEFEMRAQLGLARDDFGLPYWNWVADGENLTPARQATNAVVWSIVGGDGQDAVGSLIDDGPFAADKGFRVRVAETAFGLRAEDRALRRRFRNGGTRLPRQSDVDGALDQPEYDVAGENGAPGFDQTVDSFRNYVEGWRPRNTASQMHNRVHVWVGGDMGPGTSPNDPVFFLNHCYADKLWSDWQTANPQAPYAPLGQSPAGDPLFRHRDRDPLLSVLTGAPTVRSMLDPSAFYTYA